MVVCPKIKDHQVEVYNRQRVDDVLFSKSQRKVQAIVNTHTHMHIKEAQAQAHRSVSLSCWERGHGKQILYVCCFADIQGLTHSSTRQLTTACHSEEKTDQMLFF